MRLVLVMPTGLQVGYDAYFSSSPLGLETIAAQVNNRLLLFGNLNPFDDIERKSDEELIEVMAKQIAIGKRYGRFVVSAGSPLTPNTSLARIQKYIELGHTLSAN